VEKYGTASQAANDNIIRRMRYSCWITKARIQTHTHNFIYTMILRQDIFRESNSVLHYDHTEPSSYFIVIFHNISNCNKTEI